MGFEGGGDDDVWRLVLRQHPDLPAATATAFSRKILDLKLQGVVPSQIAQLIASEIGDAQVTLTVGLGAFEQLIETIELCGRGLEAPLGPDELMRHLVTTKLASARLMLELARLGVRAGAPTQKTVAEAEAYLAESEAELARFEAVLAARAT